MSEIISPAELAQMMQRDMATSHNGAEFSRTPAGNSRMVSFDVRLPNGQVFTVRVEEAY
jgi:hypothetical protein